MLAVEFEEPARMGVDAVRACFFKRPANRNRRVAEMPTGASSSFWQGSQFGCRRAGVHARHKGIKGTFWISIVTCTCPRNG